MHLLVMFLFAMFVAIVFSTLNSEVSTVKGRIRYGLKTFAGFMGIGLGLAWVFYFLL